MEVVMDAEVSPEFLKVIQQISSVELAQLRNEIKATQPADKPFLVAIDDEMRKRESGSLRDRLNEALAEGVIDIRNEAVKRGGRAVGVRADDGTVLIVQWNRDGVGFGELTFYVKDGKLHVDTESMGIDFCLDVMRQVFEECGV
jgi:hypothetical protein